MMTNTQQLRLAESYLGCGGSKFRNYCGLPSGSAYCVAFVVTIFAEAGNSQLFCNGRKEINCIPAIDWCYDNLAVIPLYLAMPCDIILFDWNDNEVPDHIGFAAKRISAVEIKTIEGNTSKVNDKGQVVARNVVANRKRPASDIQAVFRTQFKGKFDTSKALEIDGQFGYNSIAKLQVALKAKKCYTGAIDGILGKMTLKGIQKLVNVKQDAAWGPATSKAIQRMLGVEQDGYFGPASVKALQKWINANTKAKPASKPQPKPETIWDEANAWAIKMADDPAYDYRKFTDDPNTQVCAICKNFSRKNKNYGTNCIGWVFQIWHHGAGIPCNCSPEVINNQQADKIIRMKAADALAYVRERVGIKDVYVYRTAEYFPIKNLKEGDIVVFFHGLSYYHMGYYMGNGKFSDARSNRGVVANVTLEADMIKDIKMVIRYTGKVVV